MKKTVYYVSPVIQEYSVNAGSNFAQSGAEWYHRGGNGNYKYEVQDDETWA